MLTVAFRVSNFRNTAPAFPRINIIITTVTYTPARGKPYSKFVLILPVLDATEYLRNLTFGRYTKVRNIGEKCILAPSLQHYRDEIFRNKSSELEQWDSACAAVALQVCRSFVGVYSTHGKHHMGFGTRIPGITISNSVRTVFAARDAPRETFMHTLSQLFCQLRLILDITN